jgi:hypothetical protein
MKMTNLSNSAAAMADSARAEAELELAAVDKRASELLASAERAAVVDAETAGKAADLAKMIVACTNELAARHKDVKAPYLEAGRAVDDVKNGVLVKADAAKSTILGKLTVYQNEERAKAQAELRRKAEEERARLLAAVSDAPGVAMQAPPLVVEQPAPVRGMVATAGSKTVSEAVITDWPAIMASPVITGNDKVRDAVQKAVNALVKAGQRDLPGVTIETKHVANVR